jgi:micrococcal nuclease
MKNKKYQKILAVILIILLGITIGFLLGKTKYFQLKNTDPIPRQSTLTNQVNSYVGDYKVARVIDGDTIQIQGGEKVRYIGMDTPETVDPEKPVQFYGQEASEENRKLVEGKTVHLEKDASERDKYGRLLRYVYVGNDFINLELVRDGYARVETIAPDTKYKDMFMRAQQEAEQSKIGLWSACP